MQFQRSSSPLRRRGSSGNVNIGICTQRVETNGSRTGYESPRTPRSSVPDSAVFTNGELAKHLERRTTFSDDSSAPTEIADNGIERHRVAVLNQQNGDELAISKIVGIRDRVGCYTWTWFTMSMATGGIANVLHAIPYRSNWLWTLGVIVFIFNICLFLTNCVLIALRFRWNRGAFKASFVSQSESLFIPSCVVSAGTILINICQYGIPENGEWLHTTMQVLFWMYAGVSVFASSGLYLIMWSTQIFPIQCMTPIWIFPAYPMLIIGPLAANLIGAIPTTAAAVKINSIAIALGALCIQGTGFLVSLMIYSAFIYRLMTQKLPGERTRPGMFVSVGPSGFTVVGIVHLGNDIITKIMPNGYLGIANAGDFVRLLSDLVGLWIWGLCLWFFIVSLGAHWQLAQPTEPKHHIDFDMTWYSFVFPNTALVTATLAIGKSLQSNAIQIFGTVLAVLLVVVWICVFCLMIRALILRKLLWPGAIRGPDASITKWT